MDVFRLLIVEDQEQELSVCRDTVARYKDEKKREVELIECKNVKEAFEKLNNSFDGAIIDLKLANGGDEGKQVVTRIEKSNLRIPVAILTGTPDVADSDFAYIGVFKKGEIGAGYAELLDRFWGIHNTGLTRIMGGRGVIETTLSKVFRENLVPQKDKWVGYGETNSARTEKALLRHALSHLLQLLDDDEDRCFPEEVYLTPPLTDKIRTGSVVKEKSGETKFVVMNPACDLIIRNDDKCKTDRILVVEIDTQTSVFPSHPDTGLTKEQWKNVKKAYSNNNTAYYHWLPKTDFFAGGFLNFRKLSSLPHEEFNEKFNKPTVQISPSFVKDMVARFSAYYARQGQPDIDFDLLLKP